MAARSPNATRPLLQLTYVSRASGSLRPDDLSAIHLASERHNGRLGLTGLLLHRGDRFFAALEGPDRVLLRRMEVIIVDPRHHQLRILRERRVETRRFENWSFAALPDAGAGSGSGRAEDALITMLAGRLPDGLSDS